jgi:hypothetical protein
MHQTLERCDSFRPTSVFLAVAIAIRVSHTLAERDSKVRMPGDDSIREFDALQICDAEALIFQRQHKWIDASGVAEKTCCHYRNFMKRRRPTALGVGLIVVGVVYAEGCPRHSPSA